MMTTEEIVSTLRMKERSHSYIGWRVCKEMADALEEELAAKHEEEDRKKYLRCPYCGGRLSEDRGGYRHCFACHFEYEVVR